MGLSGVDSGGKGGRRSVDSEINMIPMIDLLIVNISFLLITAVWTQLSRLNVMQQMPGQDVAQDRPPEEKTKVTLRITEQGYQLTSTGGDNELIDKKGEVYDNDKLREILKKIHAADPDKKDLNVAPEDGVLYKNIIAAMDVVLQEGFPELSVSDGSSL